MAKATTFVLERAPFVTKEGKEMYGYFVRKTIHGVVCISKRKGKG